MRSRRVAGVSVEYCAKRSGWSAFRALESRRTEGFGARHVARVWPWKRRVSAGPMASLMVSSRAVFFSSRALISSRRRFSSSHAAWVSGEASAAVSGVSFGKRSMASSPRCMSGGRLPLTFTFIKVSASPTSHSKKSGAKAISL